MQQALINGSPSAVSGTTALEYNSISAGGTFYSNEVWIKQCIPLAGTLKSLRVKLSIAPGAGTSYTFTLRKNGADTALSVTISDSATSGSDMSNSVSVSPGDVVGIQKSLTGVPNDTAVWWTLIFDGASPVILGVPGTVVAAGTYYASLSNSLGGLTTNENFLRQVCPTNGILKDFYIAFNTSSGQGSWTFTIRKNGVDTALAVTITYPDTSGFSSEQVTVSAGDTLTIRQDPSNSPNALFAYHGVVFMPTIEGESIILGGSRSMSPSVNRYSVPNPEDNSSYSWTTSETDQFQLVQAYVVKKLYVLLETAPGASKSFTIGLRKNSVNTNLQVVISDSDTTGNDSVNQVSTSLDDLLNMIAIPSNTPAGTHSYWGMVVIPPTGAASVCQII